jgi:hypothetical protein
VQAGTSAKKVTIVDEEIIINNGDKTSYNAPEVNGGKEHPG